jgi:hypothetical protein
MSLSKLPYPSLTSSPRHTETVKLKPHPQNYSQALSYSGQTKAIKNLKIYASNKERFDVVNNYMKLII